MDRDLYREDLSGLDSYQRELYQGLSKCVGAVQGRSIEFVNNDVQNFLERLDRFEERSREVVIVVKER